MKKASEKLKKLFESMYFMCFLTIYTWICYGFKLEYAAYLGLALFVIILFLLDATFVSAPNLIMLYLATGPHATPDMSNPMIYIVILFSIIAVVLFVIKLIKRREFVKNALNKDFIFITMLALFACMWISLINAPVLFDSMTATIYFMVGIISYIVVKTTTIPNEENQRKLLFSILCVCLLLSVEMVITYFRDLKELNLGFMQLILKQKIGVSWTHANHLASLLFIGIIASGFCIIRFRALKYRIPSFLILIIGSISYIFTTSRGVIFGIAFCLPIYIYAYIKFVNDKKRDLPIFAIIISGLFIFVILFFTLDSFSEIRKEMLSGKTWNSRIEIYKTGINSLKGHYIFGAGYGSANYYIRLNLNKERFFYHNIFVEALSTLGVIGLIIFIIHIFCCIFKTRNLYFYSCFTLCILLFMLGHGLIDTTFFNDTITPMIYIILAFANSDIILANEQAKATEYIYTNL